MSETTPVVGDTASSVTSPVAPTTGSVPESAAPAVAGDSTPTDTTSSVTTDEPTRGTSIPYDRWFKVNERMKAAEARYRGLEDTFGELVKAPADVQRQLVGLLREMATEPVGHAAKLVGQLLNHPQYGTAMQAAVRQWNATHAPQQAIAEEGDVEPDLVAENGEPVYSAKLYRQSLDREIKRLETRLSERFGPVEQYTKRLQAEGQVRDLTARANEMADRELERARGWHGFTDHEADIAALMAEHAPNRETGDQGWSVQDAYLHVLHTKILPQLPAQAAAKVVAGMQQRAAAQTLNPATAPTGGPATFKDNDEGWEQALKHFSH